MELGAIVLLLLVLVIFILFVSQPLAEYWLIKAHSSHERVSLLAERERALNALQPAPEAEKPSIAPKQASLLSDEDLEDLIAKRRGERRQKTAGFCPKCGKPILQSDQFCPTCGLMVYTK